MPTACLGESMYHYYYSTPHIACPTTGDAENKSRISELIDELHSTLQVQNLWVLPISKAKPTFLTLDGFGSQAATDCRGTATQLHFHEATGCIHSFADYNSHVRDQLRRALYSGQKGAVSVKVYTGLKRKKGRLQFMLCAAHESHWSINLKTFGRSRGALSCTPPRLFDAWSEGLFWPETKCEDIIRKMSGALT